MARVFYTDIQIVENIKNGNGNHVLEYVYFKHEKETIRWIKKNKGRREEAQDIFQESLLVFYQYVIENKYDKEIPIGAFLFNVSKNKWVNRVKKINKEIHFEKIEYETISEENTSYSDKSKLTKEVLGQIGETCKELLTYSILYDLSMEDISLRMGFSSADVAKTKNYKCKKRLEQFLNDNPAIKQKLIS